MLRAGVLVTVVMVPAFFVSRFKGRCASLSASAILSKDRALCLLVRVCAGVQDATDFLLRSTLADKEHAHEDHGI